MNNINSKGNFDKYPLALPEGTAVGGKYIIKSVLGQGGFGITYLAQDYKTNELVAIKEYFPDTLATRTNASTVSVLTGDREQNFTYGKDCFLQEARTLSEFIGNPNIVRIISYFEENNTAYFVMEYVEGESLKTHLDNNGGKLSWEETKRFLFPVIDALSSVHAKGIIHRDISPDNIIITDSGNIKLIDFGAARYSLGNKSRSLDVVLKHGYAPKEQYTRHGKQGPFTDVYSLGATFYRTLTGRIPPDSIDRLEEDDLVLPSTLGSDISEDAEEAIVKALSVQPAERYQNMAEFKKALSAEDNIEIVKTVAVFDEDKNRDTVTVLMTDTKNESKSEEKDKNSKKKPILICAIAAVVLIVAIVASLLLSGDRTNTDENYDDETTVSVETTTVQSTTETTTEETETEESTSLGHLDKEEWLNSINVYMKLGVVDGNSYENNYFKIGYTVPSDYVFMSEEEMLETKLSDEELFTENNRYAIKSKEFFSDNKTDSGYSYNDSCGTFSYGNNDMDIRTWVVDCDYSLSKEDIINWKKELFENEYGVSFSECSEVEIAGRRFYGCTGTYDGGNGKTNYFSEYVTEKNGTFFYVEIDRMTFDEIEDAFFKVE